MLIKMESQDLCAEEVDSPRLSRTRTYLIVGTVGLAYVCWGSMDSLPGAFYPNEAESKGANPSEYGLVFGIIHLGTNPDPEQWIHQLANMCNFFSFIRCFACVCQIWIQDWTVYNALRCDSYRTTCQLWSRIPSFRG